MFEKNNYNIFIKKIIDRGFVPGMSLLAAKGQDILIDEVYGNKSTFPSIKKLEKGTIYDLASLTKPLITAFLAVKTIEKGLLNLKDFVSDFFEGFPYGITIKQLLTHTSGLPAWYPFYLFDEELINQYKRLKLISKPGKRVEYSCVGYILLSKIIEKIYGKSFREIAKEEIIEKLDLKNTYMGNLPEDKRGNSAPTENGNIFEREMALKNPDFLERAIDFQWREYLIHGEINDANAFYLDGNSGNAGLFSTAEDILKLSNEFYPETATILRKESIDLFWKNQTPFKKSNRTIGFKLNSSLITSGGRSLSKNSIGHNGFTGVSIWFEPETGYKFILLSNRIHPKVEPLPFNRIRRKIHKLIKNNLS